jgi:hypothetical protein
MLIYKPYSHLARIVSRIALLNNRGFPLVRCWGLLVGGVDAYHE